MRSHASVSEANFFRLLFITLFIIHVYEIKYVFNLYYIFDIISIYNLIYYFEITVMVFVDESTCYVHPGVYEKLIKLIHPRFITSISAIPNLSKV